MATEANLGKHVGKDLFGHFKIYGNFSALLRALRSISVMVSKSVEKEKCAFNRFVLKAQDLIAGVRERWRQPQEDFVGFELKPRVIGRASSISDPGEKVTDKLQQLIGLLFVNGYASFLI